MTRLGRQRRQLQELRALCASGRVGRAVDLAFEHFTDFGRDQAVLELLRSAIECCATPAAVQQRFLELCARPEQRAEA